MAKPKKTTTNKKETVKKAPGRNEAPNKTAKANATRNAAPNKTATKKTPAKRKEPTATDRVLKAVGRSKTGVSVPKIKEKTGLEDIKVRNILSQALREEKIRRVDRGVYTKA